MNGIRRNVRQPPFYLAALPRVGADLLGENRT
jgi:hypothetical protein